ncbi:MAG: alpha-galactosidase [Bacteroidia bacterium]|nr:alpha-galactosidase [Bacteroidia bacterium]
MKRIRMIKVCFISVLVCGVILSSCRNKPDAMGTSGEMKIKSKWVQKHLTNVNPLLPFSFLYDGKASSELLKTWQKKTETKRLDKYRTQYTHLWTDDKTGLEVRCVSVEYSDFSAVEWTVYFKNSGTGNPPVLKDIQGLDAHFDKNGDGEFVLHGNKGGWPYYNLQLPGGGVILAVGWPGQWASSFIRDGQNGLRIMAGQELTNLYLKPGEEIRAPLIALQFWQGTDVARAQNLWRCWMIGHNLPRTADNKPPVPMYIYCSGGFFPGLNVSETSEKQFIDSLIKEKIKIDYWWMDAGWYPCEGNWPLTGTWEPDKTRFPTGIKAVSDYAHARGIKLIVWFEPERVGDRNSWLARNHPGWLLGESLLNLGNPEVLKWVTGHVDSLITGQGIDLYRQDFNIDPLAYWRKNDSPDRQGITENLYIQGYVAYWDELRRRHPGMLIDACSSGGRRNDLETMRRAVPLLRSDYQAFDGNFAFAVGNQGHTNGLSNWFPFYGQGVYQNDQNMSYYVRSHMSPSFGICVDVRKPGIDWNEYRRLADQWRKVADCMLGDYYPLTPYSLQPDQWIAWQFNRPGQGDGMIQAFRRDSCAEPAKTFRLTNLNPAAQYEVTNFDRDGPTKLSGKELMDKGLAIEIKHKPDAAVISYTEIR